MADIKIAVINESTVLEDDDVAAVVPALQSQVHDHFAPVWGVDADLTFVPKGQGPASGSWWLTLLDDSDQAGALGYHDLTSEGLPAGKIFVKTDLDNHLSWTVTASHELLEMLGDPEIDLTVFIQPTAKSGKLFAYEVCDACEDDQFGYQIGSVKVSDFVYPAYFQPSAGTRYDYGQHLRGSVPTLLAGGYMSEFDVQSGGAWHQVMAAGEGLPHRGHLRVPVPGSRAERRRRSRDTWLKSAVTSPDRLIPPPRRAPDATRAGVVPALDAAPDPDPNRLVPPPQTTPDPTPGRLVPPPQEDPDPTPDRLVPPPHATPPHVGPGRLVPPPN